MYPETDGGELRAAHGEKWCSKRKLIYVVVRWQSQDMHTIPPASRKDALSLHTTWRTSGQLSACLFVCWLALGRRGGMQGYEDIQM